MARRAMAAKEYESKKAKGEIKKVDAEEPENQVVSNVIKAYLKVVKLVKTEQKVTGVVLEPDVFDAQKTIITKPVIREAAHKFLNGYNKTTKLGVQHNDFKKPFELCESYVAPCDLVIGSVMIKEGSWIITIKVKNAGVWKKIQSGKITGFSIGGTAKVKKLEKESLVA